MPLLGTRAGGRSLGSASGGRINGNPSGSASGASGHVACSHSGRSGSTNGRLGLGDGSGRGRRGRRQQPPLAPLLLLLRPLPLRPLLL